jgi:hypothetical protein
MFVNGSFFLLHLSDANFCRYVPEVGWQEAPLVADPKYGAHGTFIWIPYYGPVSIFVSKGLFPRRRGQSHFR